jgi:transcriptional regulator
MEDAVSKGRQAKGKILSDGRQGEKSYLAKLTESDVLEIRRLRSEGMANNQICQFFNCTKDNISKIVTRKSWSHI